MTYLYAWMIVAAAGTYNHNDSSQYMGWVNLGAYSQQRCPKAAAELGLKQFRCVDSGR